MTKRSPAPMTQAKVADFLVPWFIKSGKRQALVDGFLDGSGKVTAMLSNVPGPSEEVCLCKQPIDDIMFYTFSHFTYFGIISYKDHVNVGVVIGKGVEPEPSRIAKHWAAAFQELKDAVAVSKTVKPPADYSNLLGAVVFLTASLAAIHATMNNFVGLSLLQSWHF